MSPIDHSPLDELPTPPPGKSVWPWTTQGPPLPQTMADGSPWPRISLVTPSYNQGRFLEKTIRSVLLQKYPNLEYIVMDGGSTDHSVNILRTYSPWLTHWVSQPDHGQSHAINQGFAVASGQIFGWLNSDDFLLPRALERVAMAYRQNPSAVAWAGSCHFIDLEDRILQVQAPRGLERDSIADWWNVGAFCQPSCLIAAWAWRDANGLDESLHYAMDLDLWLRLGSLGQFATVPHSLSATLVHRLAKTQANVPEVHAEVVYVQIKHGFREAAMRRLLPLLRNTPPKVRLHMLLKTKLRRAFHRIGLRRKRTQEDRQLLQEAIAEQLQDDLCTPATDRAGNVLQPHPA